MDEKKANLSEATINLLGSNNDFIVTCYPILPTEAVIPTVNATTLSPQRIALLAMLLELSCKLLAAPPASLKAFAYS
ncbi:hypothetical protein HW132_35230 [Brasilonema sp. CT11]|nr:hypothetical protein [Brasilonema sp. CT11]